LHALSYNSHAIAQFSTCLSVQQKLNGQVPVSQGIPFVLYQKGSFRSAWVVGKEQGKRIGNYVFNHSFRDNVE